MKKRYFIRYLLSLVVSVSIILTPAQAMAVEFLYNRNNLPGNELLRNTPLGDFAYQNNPAGLDCEGNNDGQTFWISSLTDNSQQSINVPTGVNSVDLRINTFGFHCDRNLNRANGSIISKGLLVGRTNIPPDGFSAHLNSSSGPLLDYLNFSIRAPRFMDLDNRTSFKNPPPEYRFIRPPGQDPVDGQPASLQFRLSNLNQLSSREGPGPHTIVVLATVRPVNQFAPPDYFPAIEGTREFVCARNRREAQGGLAGRNCPTQTIPLSFTINIGAPVDFECSVTPGSTEAGVLFAPNPPRVTVRNTGLSVLSGTVEISGAAGSLEPPPTANIAPGGSDGWDLSNIAAPPPGEHIVTVRIAGITRTCRFTTVNKPYVRTFGGDSFAGVSDSCDGWPSSFIGPNPSSGGIYGFSNGTNQGSAAQLALASLYRIQGVKSGALSTSGLPNPPDGNPLHFANIGFPAATGVIGGHLGVSHCPANYQQAAADRTTGLTPRTTPIDAATGGLHRAADGYKLTDAAAVTGFNQRTLVYVEGNAIINSNIEYFEGPWASTDQIPSLMVVASGNIYIGSGVTRLDGIYIAQNSNPNQGVIYTCANDGAAFGSSALYGSCNRQLTINGALIANHVKFLRTFGSLRDSISGSNDYPGGVTAPCSNPSAPIASPGTCAAEVINFRPEVYLAHHILGASGTNGFKVDYIVSPPPLL